MSVDINQETSLPLFFLNNLLDRHDVDACLAFAGEVHPGLQWEELERQGDCSWTLAGRRGSSSVSCGDSTGGSEGCRGGGNGCERDEEGESKSGGEVVLLQFRLWRHAVSMGTMRDAVRIFGPMVPRTRDLESIRVGEEGRVSLQVLEMEFD